MTKTITLTFLDVLNFLREHLRPLGKESMAIVWTRKLRNRYVKKEIRKQYQRRLAKVINASQN
jgi:hypothetical protein